LCTALKSKDTEALMVV